jgi:hypothetical protein
VCAREKEKEKRERELESTGISDEAVDDTKKINW